jgi:hypothetical protein
MLSMTSMLRGYFIADTAEERSQGINKEKFTKRI